MAAEGEFPKINGDIFYAGDANLIGTFYVERTDTNASDLTHNTATWTLKQTFTFSGLTADWQLVRIEFDDISLSDSSANSNDYSRLGIIITDGTSYWSPLTDRVANIPSNAGVEHLVSPYYVDEVAASTPQEFTRLQTTRVLDHTTINIPVNLITGVTSYDVELYLAATQTAANTVTMTKGYTVRLVFSKLVQDLGTSTSQS